MKEIQLTKGYVVMVDDEDYEYLNQWHWYADFKGNCVYAAKKGIDGFVSMHRLIMNAPKNMLVDHRDHNTLNNQKYNLRICTRAQNAMNGRSHKDSSSKYHGVSVTFASYWYTLKKTGERKFYEYPPKYNAQIYINGKQTNLGTFNTDIDAAKAYDIAAKEHFGEFANLNFKDENQLSESVHQQSILNF